MQARPIQCKLRLTFASTSPTGSEEKEKALQNRACKNGRSAGARTLDPLIKSQLLYQLSYASIGKGTKANDSPPSTQPQISRNLEGTIPNADENGNGYKSFFPL